jgi:NAD(P) transhydrogenase subunit alpha
MIVAVPKESHPGECRVALVPSSATLLTKTGHRVLIEKEAGLSAGYTDAEYSDSGAEIITKRDKLYKQAEILFMVRGPGANPIYGLADLGLFRPGQALIAFLNPLMSLEVDKDLARRSVTAFALELIPRISRAQSMDALSSMSSLAGYKGVMLAANALPKIFPLMMTAAGSLMPARVFVIGAGVTGLQACATAKRMGALVSAYDIRSAVKEEVQSVGAQFVEFELPTEDAEDKMGYAKSQSEEFYNKQQEQMAKVIAESDVVITTAGVPGKKAPVLVTEEMVKGMAPRSVIVDVVAELGGNCEITEPGRTIVKYGVTIIGIENLPSTLAYHASQMLAKNFISLFDHLTDIKGNLALNLEEEITLATLLCREGEIINQRVLDAFELPPLNLGIDKTVSE